MCFLMIVGSALGFTDTAQSSIMVGLGSGVGEGPEFCYKWCGKKKDHDININPREAEANIFFLKKGKEKKRKQKTTAVQSSSQGLLRWIKMSREKENKDFWCQFVAVNSVVRASITGYGKYGFWRAEIWYLNIFNIFNIQTYNVEDSLFPT